MTNPKGRPKSDATKIKELEDRIKELEQALAKSFDVANHARAAPIEMSCRLFDIQQLATELIDKYHTMDEGLLLAMMSGIKSIAAEAQNEPY